MNEKKQNILVIAGPTGSGESTITNEIIKRYPKFARLVTTTTRPPRASEQNAVDYHFVSEDIFKQAIASGDIIEHTFVPGRNVYYGSRRSDLGKRFSEGKIVIINPDIVGARFYKEEFGATTIFVMPGSMDELRARLLKRDPDITEEEIEKRLRAAEKEATEERDFYDYEVVNADGKLNEAVDVVAEILKQEGYIA
jgi:guanylate kinase